MPLTDKQLNDVCNMYGNAYQCRYLLMNGFNGCHCAKKNKVLKRKIDKQVQEHVKKERKAGRDPYQGFKPIYDGGMCKGFIMLTTKMQGKT